MLLNVKKGQHNLKIIRRFEEDIWGVLATKNKPTQVLNFVYEAYQNNFKYKKLLKSTKKSFFNPFAKRFINVSFLKDASFLIAEVI